MQIPELTSNRRTNEKQSIILDMINHPTIDRLILQAQSPYACVIIAARRARQLNQQQQDTNDMEYITPPLVECASNNTLTIALEELANGKLVGDDPEAS